MRHRACPRRDGARYDAVVVGSGPNGLSAAIALAQAGWHVLVVERAAQFGGGLRSAALTLPGFTHDVCATVLGLGAISPAFRGLPLAQHGLAWAVPEVATAHPLDDGRAASVAPSFDETARGLGADGSAWRVLVEPLARQWDTLAEDVLSPLPLPPRCPLALAGFGLRAVWSARGLARALFRTEAARALFAGFAAHSFLSLDAPLSAAFGVMLAVNAHLTGWLLAKGGSQRFADALVAHAQSLGVEFVAEREVRTLDELPRSRAVLCDVTPRQFLRLAGDRLPASYRARLERFRYGPGIFKVDFALGEPIPWRAEVCRRAGTVHLGGTLDEIARGEADVLAGRLPERPYVLLVQPTVCDPSRAPAGKHIAWAYCHVPHGCAEDMSARIEAQIERFALGFRDCVIARATKTAPEMEAWNPNYVGGDVNGGSQDWRQHFARPVLSRAPYRTPLQGVYLCSSSTPPGGGVHGMCGWHAARCALADAENPHP